MASIYILGAGAMGSLWASHLHLAFQDNAEHPVQFITTRTGSPKNVSILLNSPFLLENQTNIKSELSVCSLEQLQTATANKPNIILICTKSYHALEACLTLEPFLNEHNYLVLFQNGLGSQHKIIDALRGIPIYAAVSTEGVNKQAAGDFVHAGKGLTQIGPLNEPAKENTKFKQCLTALAHPGLNIEANDNIRHALWEKLAINCAINPFTAILNCPNGEIKDSQLFTENWPLLKIELTEMLNTAGINISVDELEQRVFAVIENTHNNISSMLQDVRAKRKTEIDDMNGFAEYYLRKHNLKHEVNSKLYKYLERI